MTLFQAIFLGILQGLTEFLPVSSSGHLVLGQAAFGMKQSQLAFDISVHTGTLLAILVVYAAEVRLIFLSVFQYIASFFSKKKTTARQSERSVSEPGIHYNHRFHPHCRIRIVDEAV